MSKKQIIISITFGVVLLVGVFAIGAAWGYSNRPDIEKVSGLSGKEKGKPAEIDFSPFWNVWNTVHDRYINSSNIDDQALVWGAARGMVAALDDPYTVFFPPVEAKEFKESLQGNFEGVGMEIGVRNGNLVVIAPLKGTPAYRAGVKAGDRIVAIDGTPSSDLSPDRAARLIKGPRGTKVVLTMIRANVSDSIDIQITRDKIVVPIVETKTLDNSVFLIDFRSFSRNSPQLFRNALKEFGNSGADKLIVDLRGNTGGFLDAAIDTVSWFLPSGETIVTEKFAGGDSRDHKSKGYDAFSGNLPLAVLVDKGSASASEIFAGALQDHRKAIIIGTQTFGKGSVQELIRGPDGTSLKVTIAKWLTPNGTSISDKGITPDVKVEITEKDLDAGIDPQLDRAKELLLKKVK